ncbi:MAG: YkgJ family cysteine cluster protein [Chitinophagales bacterium]
MQTPHIQRLIRRGRQKKKTLGAFLKKLKRAQPRNIMAMCRQADAEMWKEIDCLDCANCCKTMTPTFTKAEVKRIAAHFNLTYDQYFKKYLKIDDDNGDIVNINQPCQHLRKDNKCAIYAIRPGDCSGFPHHVRRDFWHQVSEKTYENNIPRCPATLTFLEKLENIVISGTV